MNRAMTSSERATYQSLRSRGVGHEDALEDALEGVSVDAVRDHWAATTQRLAEQRKARS